jgi:hypothetical protein
LPWRRSVLLLCRLNDTGPRIYGGWRDRSDRWPAAVFRNKVRHNKMKQA